MLISTFYLQTRTNVTVIRVRTVRRVTMKSTPTTVRVWRVTSDTTAKLVCIWPIRLCKTHAPLVILKLACDGFNYAAIYATRM